MWSHLEKQHMKDYITIIITSSCSGSSQRTDKEDKNNKNKTTKLDKALNIKITMHLSLIKQEFSHE